MTATELKKAVYEKFGSQANLARFLKVGKPYISEMVNGHRPIAKRVLEAVKK